MPYSATRPSFMTATLSAGARHAEGVCRRRQGGQLHCQHVYLYSGLLLLVIHLALSRTRGQIEGNEASTDRRALYRRHSTDGMTCSKCRVQPQGTTRNKGTTHRETENALKQQHLLRQAP